LYVYGNERHPTPVDITSPHPLTSQHPARSGISGRANCNTAQPELAWHMVNTASHITAYQSMEWYSTGRVTGRNRWLKARAFPPPMSPPGPSYLYTPGIRRCVQFTPTRRGLSSRNRMAAKSHPGGVTTRTVGVVRTDGGGGQCEAPRDQALLPLRRHTCPPQARGPVNFQPPGALLRSWRISSPLRAELCVSTNSPANASHWLWAALAVPSTSQSQCDAFDQRLGALLVVRFTSEVTTHLSSPRTRHAMGSTRPSHDRYNLADGNPRKRFGYTAQSVATPQAARERAHPPCRHFKIQYCCCLESAAVRRRWTTRGVQEAGGGGVRLLVQRGADKHAHGARRERGGCIGRQPGSTSRR
jgi:hypothetical protein